jgi:hypothetical protein
MSRAPEGRKTDGFFGGGGSGKRTPLKTIPRVKMWNYRFSHLTLKRRLGDAAGASRQTIPFGDARHGVPSVLRHWHTHLHRRRQVVVYDCAHALEVDPARDAKLLVLLRPCVRQVVRRWPEGGQLVVSR